MKRTSTISGLLFALVLLVLGLGVSGRALAQVHVFVPGPPSVVISPPSVVVATSQPVYYEGHPSYWYGGHWYWRDGRAWRSYSSEPVYLHEHRSHGPPPRHHYEQHRR